MVQSGEERDEFGYKEEGGKEGKRKQDGEMWHNGQKRDKENKEGNI